MEHRITCRELLSRLADLVDGEVSEETRELLLEHLDECAHCLEAYRFERSFLDRIKAGLTKANLPSDLIERTLALIGTARNAPEGPCAAMG